MINLSLVISAYILARESRKGKGTKAEVLDADKLRGYKSRSTALVVGGLGGVLTFVL